MSVTDSEITSILLQYTGRYDLLISKLESVVGVSVVKGQKVVRRKLRKGEVFDKLTDHRLYTGTSRHRFTAEGVGRGAEGRDGIRGKGFKGGEGRDRGKTGGDDGFIKAEDFLNRQW